MHGETRGDSGRLSWGGGERQRWGVVGRGRGREDIPVITLVTFMTLKSR